MGFLYYAFRTLKAWPSHYAGQWGQKVGRPRAHAGAIGGQNVRNGSKYMPILIIKSPDTKNEAQLFLFRLLERHW